MVLLGFGRGSASPPKRCLRSPFRFIFPTIEQIRSDSVTPTRLRDVPALDTFLHDLPLLFRGSIYAWFPAHVPSCFGGPDLTYLRCPVLVRRTTEYSLDGFL